MFKRMAIMLLLVAAVFGGLYGMKMKQFEAMSKMPPPPPPTVSTTVAAYDDWQPQLEAVGSLRAVNGADLAFEVAGIVEQINFNSGDEVKAGDVLVKLRDDEDVNKLKSLQAVVDLAVITYQRGMKQLPSQTISQAAVDADKSELDAARANVAEQQALIDKKVIRAPFDGRLGIRAVDLGQYLAAGTTVVTLQSLDPIYVDFFLPQQALEQIRIGQAVSAKVDTYPGQTFMGEIAAIEPKVDAASRNVRVRATIKNPDLKLLPGMYATVDIATGAPEHYVTLPQTAITFNAYGNTVYIVDKGEPGADGQPQLKVRQTFVKTGETRGDLIAVLDGVKEGETVVTAGQLKLRNGAAVAVNNSVTPSADANPTPAPGSN
ncbi:MAG TPA: efflux RND transporter periplasmic adaptor subunit [Hypericibacter adhaerens]|jgi:membrane fusion protein (multidrug efflux system)|uniref:MexH family multidrug efflux RND transporter periplasmic adaptor subunit n=1 Tax=Hypericibacter adhaerens TaxID=2602016 RepID=A0A5J6MYL5_9PROT|nr:efflux RND transporter periplasmic adaptor subunit [Hypericibacter adhaerens]QEX22872.1 MexH family multidrug efflux RND transporter periplasmic adaptor subunit [Hypericibacter adhaerens]HWA44033.1 efflux RND transporter periplasmic adaptor subunit [Hypericibacter adhaerens]